MMASCKGSENVAYFQDVANRDTLVTMIQSQALKVQSGDKLLIVVNSRDRELASMFNLPISGTQIGMRTQSNTQATMTYTVDTKGNIDFPVLGTIPVKGMQRDEVAEFIKNRLRNENHCKDAVVTVEMENAYVNILGEVRNAGRYPLTKDNVTIIDALGMAGDLDIQGFRNNIMVIRKEGDKAHTYQLNMNNLQQVVSSPAYYLQQNDIVYVEPNNYRKRQTTVNGNNALSTSFWVSVGSLLTSIAVLIVK